MDSQQGDVHVPWQIRSCPTWRQATLLGADCCACCCCCCGSVACFSLLGCAAEPASCVAEADAALDDCPAAACRSSPDSALGAASADLRLLFEAAPPWDCCCGRFDGGAAPPDRPPPLPKLVLLAAETGLLPCTAASLAPADLTTLAQGDVSGFGAGAGRAAGCSVQ